MGLLNAVWNSADASSRQASIQICSYADKYYEVIVQPVSDMLKYYELWCEMHLGLSEDHVPTRVFNALQLRIHEIVENKPKEYGRHRELALLEWLAVDLVEHVDGLYLMWKGLKTSFRRVLNTETGASETELDAEGSPERIRIENFYGEVRNTVGKLSAFKAEHLAVVRRYSPRMRRVTILSVTFLMMIVALLSLGFSVYLNLP